MKILVTGANGFVGYELAARLIREGHEVTGGIGPGRDVSDLGCELVGLDLTRPDPLGDLDPGTFDSVIHLAAVASSADARSDPALAWTVNVVGTVRLLEMFGQIRKQERCDPHFLLVSTCDIYAPCSSEERLVEDSPSGPRSSYAASKLAAEIAAAEVVGRTGLRLLVARPFPHSGAGQDTRFVVPDFVRKIREAKESGAKTVAVGDLRIVRELLHVHDVVDAYVRLLYSGASGPFNVARGDGISLAAVFDLIADTIGYHPEPVPTAVGRATVQIGDSTRLRNATGWRPTIGMADVVREVARLPG